MRHIQTVKGMNSQSHSRRQHTDVLIKYKNILNKPALNNVLASGNESRQKCPVSDQTDAFADKGQMITHENTD